jgi:hypothetical protein
MLPFPLEASFQLKVALRSKKKKQSWIPAMKFKLLRWWASPFKFVNNLIIPTISKWDLVWNLLQSFADYLLAKNKDENYQHIHGIPHWKATGLLAINLSTTSQLGDEHGQEQCQ